MNIPTLENIKTENVKEINKDININNEIEEKQKNFFQTALGSAINTAIDFGLKKLLPDFIEEQVIQIKDTLFQNGLIEAIKTGIDKAVDLGKNIVGIVTGDFKNISQMELAVQKGGLIESASDLINNAVNKAEEKNLINSDISSVIKKGKNIIEKDLTSNINEMLENQKEAIKKVNKYCENWNKYYELKDFEKMNKEYEKIEKEVSKIVPLEEIINKVSEIENIHNLIKNNGNNFEITQTEKELAKILV